MGALDLLGNFFKKQTPQETNYLSLTITSDQILATIWQLEGKTLKFIGHSEKGFHNIDSLIHETAVVIDDAATKVKNDVSQVVFGLSYYWFEDGQISKETLNILKNLADELELEAQAFVPIAASINHFLKIEKSAIPNVVYLGLFKDFTEAALIADDKATPQTYKGEANEDNIVHILEQLKTKSGKKLPHEIMLFSTNQKDHLAKELKKMDLAQIFEQDITVKILSAEEIAKCVAYSQAADVLGYEPTLSLPPGHEQIVENAETISQKEDVTVPSGGFDFREGEDVLAAEILENAASEVETKQAEEISNVSAPKRAEDYAVELPAQEDEHVYESPKEMVEQRSQKHKKKFLDSLLTLSWLSNLRLPIGSGNSKKWLLAGAAAVVVVLVGVFFLASTITSAQVILKANTQSYESDFDVSAIADAALDPTQDRIPAQLISETVADSQQAQATGTKKVGNNAKGAVTVFNWTTNATTFDKGTIIISKNGVKFNLDDVVQVASRSASTPGQATVPVVAQDFGSSGNISGGTDFTFQKYDELLYSAKNDNAFAGGDEKQITVASADDVGKLEKTLTESLKQKAKGVLQGKNQQQQIDDNAIDLKVTKKQFDKKIDDEATIIKLDMEVEASVLVYDQGILKDLLSQKASQTQSKLESKSENIELLQTNVKRNKSSLIISGNYRANLTPKLDEDDIKNKIAGKSVKGAKAAVQATGDFVDLEAKFTPNLLFFSTIPKNKSKITLKVEVNK